MTEWGYSQLIFTEKKIMFIHNVQAMLLQSERVSEMHFPAIWRPEFQNFLSLYTLGIPHGDSKLSKLQEKTGSIGENGCRQKCLDRSLNATHAFEY